MYGSNERVDMQYQTRSFSGSFKKTWEGYVNNLQRRYGTSTSDGVKSDIERLMRNAPCDACGGKRLKKEALAVPAQVAQCVHLAPEEAKTLYELLYKILI